MTWWTGGRHESGPQWARAHGALLQAIDRKLGALMATQQELTDGVHQLFGAVDSVIAKLQSLVNAGTFDPQAAQALLDEVSAERQRAADALSSVNPPAPPTPTDPNAPATPTA